MDILFLIRSGIFLTAALIVILFPQHVLKFQNWFFIKFGFKARVKNTRGNYIVGIIFILIAIGLFIYAVMH